MSLSLSLASPSAGPAPSAGHCSGEGRAVLKPSSAFSGCATLRDCHSPLPLCFSSSAERTQQGCNSSRTSTMGGVRILAPRFTSNDNVGAELFLSTPSFGHCAASMATPSLLPRHHFASTPPTVSSSVYEASSVRPWRLGEAASSKVAAPASMPAPRPSLAQATTRKGFRHVRCHVSAIVEPLSYTDESVCEKSIGEVEREMAVSSSEYNQRMRRAMANPYEYHHHLGMYYTRILPKLIVGSQPQSEDDISKLHYEEGVDVVLNLQQDHDIAYWGINIPPIQQRCHHHGMRHYRRPAVDFDPHSLRHHLPRMVSVIEHNISEGRSVYVHCTAGLGRAPASAIAYLFWFQNMDLKRAYDFLTSKRPCGPKWDAIRGATYDLAKEYPNKIPLEHLPNCAFSDVSQWERDVIQLRVRQLYHH